MTYDDNKNSLEIMRQNIRRNPVGSKLTPQAQEKAAQFAVSVWKGQMGNGEASQIGIKAVTKDILK